MTTTGPAIRLRGVPRLLATLRQARHAIRDATPAHATIGDRIVSGQAPTAPRDTGALAAAPRATAEPGRTVITVGVPHAKPVHLGVRRGPRLRAARPWITRYIIRTRRTIVREYTSFVQKQLDKIKGD